MLSGADPMESGEVTLEGKKLHIRTPKDALEQGITLLPEDRKRQGLFLGLPIDQNISIASLEQFSRFGVMLRHRQRRKVLEQIKVLRIATPSPGPACQKPQRRQPTEGCARQVAHHQRESYDLRRTHARRGMSERNRKYTI